MGGALDANPDAPFAYTDAWVLDDGTGRIRRASAMFYQRPPRTLPDARAFFLLLLERNFVYTSVTVRRSILDEVGSYDEDLSTGEDWDLWLRIVGRGMRPVRPPGLLAIHRNHPSSLVNDTQKMTRNICEVYRRVCRGSGCRRGGPDARPPATRRVDSKSAGPGGSDPPGAPTSTRGSNEASSIEPLALAQEATGGGGTDPAVGWRSRVVDARRSTRPRLPLQSGGQADGCVVLDNRGGVRVVRRESRRRRSCEPGRRPRHT